MCSTRVTHGQDGDDRVAPILHNSARLRNGNFPCSHQCKDRYRCNHVCCKEGVAKRSGSTTKKDSNPRLATDGG